MKKNIIIIVLLLLVIFLGGYVGYDYLTYKKENKIPAEKVNDEKSNSANELKKLDDSKDLIYLNTETIGKLLAVKDESCAESKEDFENWLKDDINTNESLMMVNEYKKSSLIDDDANIIIKYPIINIDNETVNKINEEIKKYIDEGKQRIIEGEQNYGTKYTINGQTKYSSGFNWNEVEINDSQKYISIIFRNYSIVACGGWGSNVLKIRYINKETGLEASEYDILENYNYKNIDDLKSSIKDNEEVGIDLSSIHSPYIDSNEKLHIFAVTNGDSEFIVENNEIKEID